MTTHTPTIAEQAQAMATESAARLPAEFRSAFTADQAALDASDPGSQLAAALGVETQPSADAIAAQMSLGLDLTERNADGKTNLPMPTVAAIDSAGVIRWSDVHPNYATRSEVPDILAAVDAMS